MSESDTPEAILPIVPHEHGHITIPSYEHDPDAKGAANVSSEYIEILSFSNRGEVFSEL